MPKSSSSERIFNVTKVEYKEETEITVFGKSKANHAFNTVSLSFSLMYVFVMISGSQNLYGEAFTL